MTSPLLIDVPNPIVGERVLLRAYRPGDGPALNEAVILSLDHLKPWMPWAQKPPSIQESEETARRLHARWQSREDLTVGIWNLEQTRLLGGSGLHRIDWEVPKFEIGYWIRPDEEGKGLVSETVTLLRDVAFRVLGANRVFIRCASTNLRSAAIPLRLGFEHEGTLRNEAISTEGLPQDIHVFGITRTMWLNLVGYV